VILKPFGPFANNYYYHKSGGYNVVAQAMVDCNKEFIDLFIGLFGSVNDSQVLQKKKIYKKAMYKDLLHLD
jgi:hypothetical protein